LTLQTLDRVLAGIEMSDEALARIKLEDFVPGEIFSIFPSIERRIGRDPNSRTRSSRSNVQLVLEV
jgi:hypothetical protein